MKEKKYVTQREASEEMDNLNGEFIKMQLDAGLERKRAELHVNWLKCITGINPIEPEIEMIWGERMSMEQFRILSSVFAKVEELAKNFKYTGYYLSN